jgi:tetratricopeptide (TPR) repeat protein
MNSILPCLWGSVACLMLACLTVSAAAQDKYKTFEEARNEGAKLLRNQQLAEAQAPLEAALRLAPDDKARLDVYQALVPVYRMLPEIDKKLEADEFIIRNSERRAARSNAARDLVSFLHQRGKLDVAIERYEALLKTTPDDVAALAALTNIYARLKRDETKAADLGKRLEAAERELARAAAQRLEQAALGAPQTMATQLKDAAQLWVEAGERAKAVAAARRSASGPPEQRNELLTYYWHDGLGDVFLATGEAKLAVAQFEAALAVIKLEPQRRATEKKLAAAREAAALQ